MFSSGEVSEVDDRRCVPAVVESAFSVGVNEVKEEGSGVIDLGGVFPVEGGSYHLKYCRSLGSSRNLKVLSAKALTTLRNVGTSVAQLGGNLGGFDEEAFVVLARVAGFCQGGGFLSFLIA